VNHLYQRLVSLIQEMKDPHYKALAEAILIHDSRIVAKLLRAPAAKSVHHAYEGGLIEHIVSVSEILLRVSQHYDSQYKDLVNIDLCLLGGFLHDLCKIDELDFERATEYTTAGKLIGHLVMGVELVEAKARELGNIPEEKKLLIKHILLSHHGEYDYGSPKRPKTLEAYLVHAIDDLDSKMNAMGKFILNDTTAGEWTTLNKMYERYFYKGNGRS
jgi:3'-5' exoribonuclease